jgi:polysaccharide chain length determinant protein (PEP-CTERM system associated)
VLLPFLGFGVGVLAPKTYTAHTTILVQDAAEANPFLKDINVPTALEDRMDGITALMRSRAVLGLVAEDLGWIAPDSGEAERGRQIYRLGQMISVRLIGNDLIEINANDRVPDHLKAVLQTVSNRLIERVVAPGRSAIANSGTFLDEQLAQRRAELDAAERELAAYKTEHAAELPELQAANIVRLAALRSALVDKRGALAGAEAAFTSRQGRIAETNPVIGRIEQEQVAATAELTLLRAAYTDEHSKVQAVLRKLSRLQEERAQLLAQADTVDHAELGRLWNLAAEPAAADEQGPRTLLVTQLADLQTADAEREQLGREVANIEGEIASLEKVVAAQSGHERRMSELTRDLTVKRDVYEALLKRAEMARVTVELNRFEDPQRINVIDQPFTPSGPSTPPPLLFAIIGIVAGMALGAGLAVVSEIADTTLRRAKDIEALTGLAVLARIPLVGQDPVLDLTATHLDEGAVHA